MNLQNGGQYIPPDFGLANSEIEKRANLETVQVLHQVGWDKFYVELSNRYGIDAEVLRRKFLDITRSVPAPARGDYASQMPPDYLAMFQRWLDDQPVEHNRGRL